MPNPLLTGQSHPFKAFLLFLLLLLICGLLFNLMGALMAIPLFGMSFSELFTASATAATPENAAFIKYYQIVNHLGMFTVPSVLYIRVFMRSGDVEMLGFKRLNFFSLLASVLILFAALPFTNRLIMWNASMHLPDFLGQVEEMMRKLEDSAAGMTTLFFQDTRVKGLWVNIFMIALVPAVGEELVFRGVLFRIFHKWIRNVHGVVVVTALLFSFMHMQFYGFFPRLFLGIMFGYLFVFTRSIWVPMFVHFINNGTAVISAWYGQREGIPWEEIDRAGSEPTVAVLLSIVFIFILFGLLRKMERV
ncbi:MAG: CPBP family intramembrane metalloprotease [Bacteroidales bacterium]|nr:CPBP family intramembrane metalloprotease [Bacteroidales bacterium]